MRASRGSSPHLQRIVKQYFQPLFGQLSRVLKEGIAAGDFRPVDPMQFVPTMISVIVFYFTNAPVMRIMSGKDPLDAELVSSRRAAVLDFISAALFQHADKKKEVSRK